MKRCLREVKTDVAAVSDMMTKLAARAENEWEEKTRVLGEGDVLIYTEIHTIWTLAPRVRTAKGKDC